MLAFFNTNQFSDTNYFTIEETRSKLSCCDNKSFSIRHLNIRSFKKNLDKLVNFVATLSFNFKVICVTETWYSGEPNNSGLYKLTNYNSIHQTRSSGKTGGGLAIFDKFYDKDLYDKFLKSKTNENEKKYKTYKSLFEILKEKSEKIYYSRKLENCK